MRFHARRRRDQHEMCRLLRFIHEALRPMAGDHLHLAVIHCAGKRLEDPASPICSRQPIPAGSRSLRQHRAFTVRRKFNARDAHARIVHLHRETRSESFGEVDGLGESK
jgi:hypothetical protein